MGKFAKGVYNVKNKQKYIGRRSPIYRSSWESVFFTFCDLHPSVLQWCSEGIRIPYRDPLTGKMKGYFPDVFLVYMDVNGKKCAELVEIKPSSQTGQRKTKSAVNNAQIIKNQAKWSAALQYCETNGIKFRIITELEMFKKGSK
jgi:hypothetical protein